METLARRLEAVTGPGVSSLREEPHEAGAGPREAGGVRGTLMYSAEVELGGRHLMVRNREDVARAMEVDPESLARVFAAFGSPFRIALLRSLLERPRTSQELQAVIGAGGVGQLYHHLRELQSAHLVVQERRSVYAIPRGRLMLVCVLLATAPRLISNGQPPPAPGEADELDDHPHTEE